MLSIREKFKTCNSLICLLRALKGRITTVELRNESLAEGRIDNVDGFMNVEMSAVSFTSPSGQTSRMDSFFVQGPQIRYVQIPSDINIVQAMQEQIVKMGFGGAENSRGRGRGSRGQRHKMKATNRSQQLP